MMKFGGPVTPPPNTIDDRRIWGRVRVEVARLAQARQNQPAKGELDLTDNL